MRRGTARGGSGDAPGYDARVTARGPTDATGRLTLAAGAALVLGGTLAALLVGPRLIPGPGPSPTATARLDVPGDWRPVAWSPDGTRLLVGGAAGFALVGRRDAPPPSLSGAQVAAWRPTSGHELALVQGLGSTGEARLDLVADGPSSSSIPLPIRSAAQFTWSADGQTWAIASGPGPGVVAGRVGSDQVLSLPDLGPPIALSPDGRTVAGRAAATGSLLTIQVAAPFPSGPMPAAPVGSVTIAVDARIAFSPDGRWLALADGRTGLRVVPADGTAPATTIEPDVTASSVTWAPHLDELLALRAGPGPSGAILASLGPSGVQVRQLGPAGGLSWAAGGGRAVIVMADGRVVGLPLASDTPASVLASGADPTCPALLGPDGALAYCGSGGLVVLGP